MTNRDENIGSRQSALGSSLRALLRTQNTTAPAIARVALGAVILPHGLQKVFGLFGGGGFAATMESFTAMGLPWIIALAVIAIEFAGAIALILGLVARLAAAGVAAVMVGAIATVHAPHGFFMNWYGAQQGEGYEYHILALGLAAAVLVAGAGRWSIDRALAQ